MKSNTLANQTFHQCDLEVKETKEILDKIQKEQNYLDLRKSPLLVKIFISIHVEMITWYMSNAKSSVRAMKSGLFKRVSQKSSKGNKNALICHCLPYLIVEKVIVPA